MVSTCKWNFMVLLSLVSLLFQEINAASGNISSNVDKRNLIHHKLTHETLCMCVMKTQTQCLDDNPWDLLLNESSELFECMIPCINLYRENDHKSEYIIDIQNLHSSIITIKDVENALKQIETYENLYKEYNRILKQYLVSTSRKNSFHECFRENNIKFLANLNENMHEKCTILRTYEIFVKYVHLVVVVVIYSWFKYGWDVHIYNT
ncbi:hypothetical protein C0J52_22925 [Blattella germanica]|nr:hypothetical protein C0J52_22925 [Blattella germanica]